MKNLILKIIILLLILAPINVEAEPNIKFTSSGKLIRWKKNAINVCILPQANIIPNIKQALKESIDNWNKVGFVPKFSIKDEDCNVQIDFKLLKGWSYPAPLATTTIDYMISTGLVISSEIIINSNYFPELGDAEQDKSKYDLQSILTHELGHVLGLDEDMIDTKNSMYLVTHRGTYHKRKIKEVDILAVSKIYF